MDFFDCFFFCFQTSMSGFLFMGFDGFSGIAGRSFLVQHGNWFISEVNCSSVSMALMIAAHVILNAELLRLFSPFESGA